MSIPSLSPLSGFTTAARTLANVVLVQPTKQTGGYQAYQSGSLSAPLNDFELSEAFVFNYEGEQSVTCESDITDHFTELNVAIADHIALKPVMITTQGFISELNDIVDTNLAPFQPLIEKLQTISAYVPELTQTAQRIYNFAEQTYQFAKVFQNANISSWGSLRSQNVKQNTITANTDVRNSLLQNNTVQTAQQTAFQKFYGWWSDRRLFSVLTPWCVFQNMAIQSLKPIQSEDTRMITTFAITFKQIRTTNTTQISLPPSAVTQSRGSDQRSSVSKQGVLPAISRLSLGVSLQNYSIQESPL